jgi:hypothetical protein
MTPSEGLSKGSVKWPENKMRDIVMYHDGSQTTKKEAIMAKPKKKPSQVIEKAKRLQKEKQIKHGVQEASKKTGEVFLKLFPVFILLLIFLIGIGYYLGGKSPNESKVVDLPAETEPAKAPQYSINRGLAVVNKTGMELKLYVLVPSKKPRYVGTVGAGTHEFKTERSQMSFLFCGKNGWKKEVHRSFRSGENRVYREVLL